MKKFLIGLASGFVLAGLTAVILIFILVRFASSFGDARPTIADGSTLIFKLEGSVPEKTPTEMPIPILQENSPLSLQQVWETFRKAALDPKGKAILTEPPARSAGWNRFKEIRMEMEQFRKSGKPLVAFLRNPGT